eukprot:2232919-Pleurochrysis_carterae.AAC.2
MDGQSGREVRRRPRGRVGRLLLVRAWHGKRLTHGARVERDQPASAAERERVRVVRVPSAASEDPLVVGRRRVAALRRRRRRRAVRQLPHAYALPMHRRHLLRQHRVPQHGARVAQRHRHAQLQQLRHLGGRRRQRRRRLRGVLTFSDSLHSPQRNALLRAVGMRGDD